jgi:hypothetical protein
MMLQQAVAVTMRTMRRMVGPQPLIAARTVFHPSGPARGPLITIVFSFPPLNLLLGYRHVPGAYRQRGYSVLSKIVVPSAVEPFFRAANWAWFWRLARSKVLNGEANAR